MINTPGEWAMVAVIAVVLALGMAWFLAWVVRRYPRR